MTRSYLRCSFTKPSILACIRLTHICDPFFSSIHRKHDGRKLILTLLFIGCVEAQPGPCSSHKHSHNRNKVCAVCLLKSAKTKNGFRTVNEHQAEMIREKVNKIYDRDNMCLPTGLCNPCRLKLERPYTCKKYPDYSKIFSNGSLRWTRERQDKEDQCSCKICVVSSANSNAYKKMVKKWKGKIIFDTLVSTGIFSLMLAQFLLSMNRWTNGRTVELMDRWTNKPAHGQSLL